MVFTSDFGAVIVTVAMKVDGVSSMLRGNDENMGGDVDGGRCGQGFGIFVDAEVISEMLRKPD